MVFPLLLLPASRLLRDKFLLGFLLLLAPALVPALAQAQFPGGFLEQPMALSTTVEPMLSPAEIQGFVPQRGRFTFPAPYNTQAIRLTNASDCNGGGDCVNAVGYSYWRNINNHVGQDTMLILVGFNQQRGGAGLSLLQYNKVTEAVTNLGTVFAGNLPYSGGSGEGWYFSATLPTKMYLHSGSKILRYDVISKQFETILDITTKLGAGHQVHQIHSSNDDLVHSATVQNAGGAAIGCMAYETNTNEFHYFPSTGDYDECQIDRSGKWLVIKENVDGAEGEDNRIINLDTGNERLLRDSDGAGGHSDLGYGYMIASDNWGNESNTQRIWDFNAPTLDGYVTYTNRDWNVGAPAHISHTNSKPGVAPERQYACGSSANRRNSPEANEVICFRLDGSRDVLVVAPVMTDLDKRGGDDYDNSPKGNLDVTGQYFIWTSNMGGDRLDTFLVKVPGHLLTGGAAVTSTPSVPNPVIPAVPGSGAPDHTLPLISSLSAGAVTGISAAISWTTSEPSDSRVEYGTTSAYGSAATLGLNFGTSHVHTLLGLSPNTQYHYRVRSADVAGNAAWSGNNTFTTTGVLSLPAPVTPATPGAIPSGAAAVTWIERVNVTANGGTVQKTAGCDGCADAGAASQQVINGNGYLEFTATTENSLRLVGLSDNNTSTKATDIDFGIGMQGTAMEVRENGIYRTDLRINAGDVFRISVTNGVVKYARNGTVFYTSGTAAGGALRADTAFFSAGASISNAVMSASSGTSAPPPATTPAPAPVVAGVAQPVVWTGLANVSANGGTVRKVSGCDGCADAGAVSTAQITAGSGYIEFTATVENKLRVIGLTGVNATHSDLDIRYGIRLESGIAEVREAGVYRWDATVNAGDVFRVTVENGVVSYAKNGVKFYTSTVAAAYPLRADAMFASTGGSFSNAVMSAP